LIFNDFMDSDSFPLPIPGDCWRIPRLEKFHIPEGT
jgi:hypothetical protein